VTTSDIFVIFFDGPNMLSVLVKGMFVDITPN
jgi:hypothetical protein